MSPDESLGQISAVVNGEDTPQNDLSAAPADPHPERKGSADTERKHDAATLIQVPLPSRSYLHATDLGKEKL